MSDLISPPPAPEQPPTAAGAERGAALVLLAASLLLALFLNAPTFLYRGLAIDEAVSFWIADRSSPSTLLKRSLDYSATPPLSFLLQRAALDLLGAREYALRLPACAAYLGSLLAAAWLGRRWLHPLAGGVAALLLAVHPTVLKLAVEGRPYSLGLLLSILAAAATERVARSGFTAARAGVWIALNVALAYTHYLFVLFWPVELWWLVGAVRAKRIGPGRLLAAGAVTVLAGLPLALSLGRVWEQRYYLNWVRHVPRAADSLEVVLPLRFDRLAHPAPWLASAAVLVWLTARYGMGRGSWVPQHRVRGLARAAAASLFWGVAPVLGTWLLGRFWIPSLATDRYVLIAVPGAVLFVAGLVAAPRGVLAPLVIAGIFLWLEGADTSVQRALGLWAAVRSEPGGAPRSAARGWKEATEALETIGDEETALVGSGLAEMSLVPIRAQDRVFQDYVTCRLSRMYRPGGYRRLSLPTVWTSELAELYRADLEPVGAASPGDEPRAAGSVWVVAATDTDVLGATAEAAALFLDWAGWQKIDTQQFEAVRVEHYVRRAARAAASP